MDFLKDIAKTAGNEYAALVSEGVRVGDVDLIYRHWFVHFQRTIEWFDLWWTMQTKLQRLQAESATGKTFFVMGMVKSFLDANPDAGVLYFESESAITQQMVIDRGIDPSQRMVILPVTTVQEFRTQAIRVLDKYMETPEDQRQPMMLCLDSLGMLSTTKEVDDTSEGKETRDMTISSSEEPCFVY